MKIGLVGYQGSGKSTLFEWLTGVPADPAHSHTTQSAMAVVPDPRVQSLCDVYHPKKVTQAALEIVDTPGLSRTHEGNPARLALIREAACLLQVIAAFDGSDADPERDLQGFEEDMLLTDLEIVSGRVERLGESLKKPRPNREQQQAELAAIQPILQRLEGGQPLTGMELTDEQLKAIRSFQLLTQKQCLAIVNVADDEQDLQKYGSYSSPARPVIAVPVGLEVELARMTEQDREEFRQEMGIPRFDRDTLIQQIMDQSGQMLFFTASEKEVRTWLIPKGATAVEAAESIHTDLARGFIRAEVMTCDDLSRLGSEREIKAQHLMRQEHKDYVIQDGDILHIRFSV
jgi:GTP-binding protein YchF